jgi:hypothetical protein
MSLVQSSIKTLGKPLPKVISPKNHAIADYATAALFLLGGVLFWKRSKRAAIASLLCGAAEASVAALTDYPGGVKRVISFPLHQKIDYGLSSLTAAAPRFLAFEDEKERAFFRMQSVMMTSVTVLTDFGEHAEGEQKQGAA